jgi:Suppressor of fused protein (SUFU)
VLYPIGLSDHRLPMGRIKSYYNELRIHLSPEWPLTPEALSRAEWNWPIEWMKRIASELRSADRIEESQLFLNGSPPQPLAPSTKLCGWVGQVCEGAESTFDVEGGKTVYTLVLYPIYGDEIALVEKEGVDELAYRLRLQSESQGHPSWIDPSRPSVAGDDGVEGSG